MTGLARTPVAPSRLPRVGTTIFTTMSALAQQHGAVNLGQGFPDFACDPRLIDAVTHAMQAGHNQYPPMAGVAVLREAVASKIEALCGHRYDPGNEITITAGATQAILTAILALVHPGDEVIVLEPCYDSYEPNIELAGGKVVRVPLESGSFRPDFKAIENALTPRTRAMLVNTPHNPSAAVWSEVDMHRLASLLRPTDVIVIADEVYEHMVYDGAVHQSVARHPELAARSVLISSFGKSFHVTGWKVGYAAAPAALSAEFRKVHQFNVFTVNTPMQHAIARYLTDPGPYRACRRSTKPNAIASAAALLPLRCACYPARAATSSAWTIRPWANTATETKRRFVAGSLPRSASRRFRCRRSTRRGSSSAWCAFALPSSMRPSTPHCKGCSAMPAN